MNEDKIRVLMMKVVDGLATPEEEETLSEMIENNDKWKTELRAYRKIKEVTDNMQFKELPDSYWDNYWARIYRRTERGLGWILMSVGAVILIAFGLYHALPGFYSDPNVHIIVKIGVSAAGLGIIILLVSILRERLFARNHERYEKEVER